MSKFSSGIREKVRDVLKGPKLMGLILESGQRYFGVGFDEKVVGTLNITPVLRGRKPDTVEMRVEVDFGCNTSLAAGQKDDYRRWFDSLENELGVVVRIPAFYDEKADEYLTLDEAIGRLGQTVSHADQLRKDLLARDDMHY